MTGSPQSKRARIEALAAARGANTSTETCARNAITLEFYREVDAEPFQCHPAFTHQIFENETISGYKRPALTLGYNWRTLESFADFAWAWRDERAGLEVLENGARVRDGATDVLGRLGRFRKSGCLADWEELKRSFGRRWTLPVKGDPVAKYRVGEQDEEGRTFRVFKEKLVGNERLKEFHRRLQFLMFVSIDGASFIDEDDERWELFLVFGSDDEIVAYATVYPFSSLANKSLKEGFRDRIRVSQVLVLPMYQRQGHGRRVLMAVYDDAKKRNAMEVTVEDPSEGFRRLRDGLDLSLCYEEGILDEDIDSIEVDEIDGNALKRMRKELLLTAPQARRVAEIHCCRAVPWNIGADRDEDEENMKVRKRFRLMVKRRLFSEYEEVLSIFDGDLKKDKLHEIYKGYESAYQNVANYFANQ